MARLQHVAEPIVLEEATNFVVELTDTLKELDGCRSDADIQNLASKIDQLNGGWKTNSIEDGTVVSSIQKAELALRKVGQTVKAKRMAKVGTLIKKLSHQKPKKQRKTLRKILELCAKNLGLFMGKRGMCCGTNSLCCNVAIITGSVLAVAGAATVVVLASLGEFDEAAHQVNTSMTEHEEAHQNSDLVVDEVFGKSVQKSEEGTWSVTVNDDVDQAALEDAWEAMLDMAARNKNDPDFASGMAFDSEAKTFTGIPDEMFGGPGGAKYLLTVASEGQEGAFDEPAHKIAADVYGKAVQESEDSAWSVSVNIDVDQAALDEAWQKMRYMADMMAKHFDDPDIASGMAYDGGRTFTGIPDEIFTGPGGAQQLLIMASEGEQGLLDILRSPSFTPAHRL